MKNIVSWNVNGIRAAEKKGLFEFLQNETPDLLCLQETKARPEQLNKVFTEQTGYKVYWSSAKRPGYSGTAIYSKEEPDSVRTLGKEDFDNEGRVLIADIGNLSIINCYFPNSQAEGARLDYKLAFCEAILRECDDLVRQNQNVVICGDFNIAHKPIDLARPKANEKNPGYLPEERAWMDTYTSSGYVDTFRMFHPEPEQYTWWSYRMNAREKNIGWRLDYHCVNEGFKDAVVSSEIQSDIYGSDHCPVKIALDV